MLVECDYCGYVIFDKEDVDRDEDGLAHCPQCGERVLLSPDDEIVMTESEEREEADFDNELAGWRRLARDL